MVLGYWPFVFALHNNAHVLILQRELPIPVTLLFA